MPWTAQRPIFFVFEGGDGSGKTTQARLLYEQLKRSGRMVTYTDEPGATIKGFQIRTILLDKNREPLDPIAELLLFEADRAQHVARVIKPLLEEGSDIICDRFSPSLFAYQGYGRGLFKKHGRLIRDIDALTRQRIVPDLYVLLDLDPVKALRRIKRGQTRFEKEALAFHQRVRAGFLAQAREDKKRWLVVDATKSVRTIQALIFHRVETLIAQRRT